MSSSQTSPQGDSVAGDTGNQPATAHPLPLPVPPTSSTDQQHNPLVMDDGDEEDLLRDRAPEVHHPAAVKADEDLEVEMVAKKKKGGKSVVDGGAAGSSVSPNPTTTNKSTGQPPPVRPLAPTASPLDDGSLASILEHRNLPQNLKRRLLNDSEQGMPHFNRLPSILDIDCMQANSSYTGTCFTCCTCSESQLIPIGSLGRYRNSEEFHFLSPGYHKYPSCGSEFLQQVSVKVVNQPIRNGTTGFVTITEKCLGVMVVGGEYRLLAPGVYQWFTAAVTEVTVVDITLADACALGPYTLLTVQVGDAAVTYNHGTLKILGHDESSSSGGGGGGNDDCNPNNRNSPHTTSSTTTSASSSSAGRTFFLDDPMWKFKTTLSMRRQTDRLEGNDLLSRDNVEVLMVAMAQWRIENAHLCASRCSTFMKSVHEKVDSLVRSTIARIVAGSALGQGGGTHTNAGHVGIEVASHTAAVAAVAGGGGGGAEPVALGHEEDDDGTLAHVMLSKDALQHMAELRVTMHRLGIEVFGVYIPEKRIKSDETRRAVASQAVIGIRAEQERSSADADAYATTMAARAEAESISVISQAHKIAGDTLGPSKGTGAKLALAQQTGKALKEGTAVTLFNERATDLPYLLAPEEKSLL